MSEIDLVEWAIGVMRDLFREDIHDMYVSEKVIERLIKEHNLSEKEAKEVARKALDYWVNVYYPD